MFKKLKRKLKDYIVELADLFISVCQRDLLIRAKSSFNYYELTDGFIQTQIHVERPIDFGLELDSFFLYLEQENKSTDLYPVSIIPVDKNTYLVTFNKINYESDCKR